MKILIVGGAGYIGGYLTDILNKNKYNVTVYDNLLYENRYLKDINFIYGDVSDFSKINPVICLSSSIRAKTINICKVAPQAKTQMFLLSKLRSKTLLKVSQMNKI